MGKKSQKRKASIPSPPREPGTNYYLWMLVVVLVVSGIAEGFWTNRWLVSQRIQETVDRLSQVPLQMGDWVGEDEKLNDAQQKAGEIAGYLLRNYTNQQTGETVTMLLVCGRSGPISVHPPTACYTDAGYKFADDSIRRKPLDVEGVTCEFWTAAPRKERAGNVDQLRILWSWSGDGNWLVPNEPRVAFVRYPVLFKMYVYRPMLLDQPSSETALEEDPCVRFAEDHLIAEVNRALFDEG